MIPRLKLYVDQSQQYVWVINLKANEHILIYIIAEIWEKCYSHFDIKKKVYNRNL